MVSETEDLIIIPHDNRENNKSVRQGRRGGKPQRQDEKVTFERMARRHYPDYRPWAFKIYFTAPKTAIRTKHYIASRKTPR